MVAAGRGTRLGAGLPKALVPLGHGPDEAPIVVHALRGALRCRSLSHVVVVAPPDPEGMGLLTAAVGSAFPLSDRTRVRHAPEARSAGITVVPGGAERSDSVALGLAALDPAVGIVLVHDAARALTPPEVFDRVVASVREGHAAVTPALPITDTIKQVSTGPAGVETVVATVDRSSLRAVQTPQGFLRETLERAHAEAGPGGPQRPAMDLPPGEQRLLPVTDDCGMVEAVGGRVHVLPGDPCAMKVTTPHDLAVAAAWLRQGVIREDAAALSQPGR